MANGQIGLGAGRLTGRAVRGTGQFLGNVAGAGIQGAAQSVTPESLLKNLLGVASPGVIGVPDIAVKEGTKVLKNFYKGMAEEMISQPGGAEALAMTLEEQGGGIVRANRPPSGAQHQGTTEFEQSALNQALAGQPVTSDIAPSEIAQTPEFTAPAGQATTAAPSQKMGTIRDFKFLPSTSPFQQSQVKLDENGNLMVQQGGMFDFNAGMTNQTLTQLGVLQELTGLKPLQAGEREKIELTADLEAINKAYEKGITATDKLTGEAAKNLGNANIGLQMIDGLNAAFDKNPNLFSFNIAATSESQMTRTSITNLADILGRMRSGGAINDEELATFKKLLPLTGAIKGRIEKAETVKFKLQTLKNLLQDIKSGIQPDLVKANFVVNAINAGSSPSDINRYLQSKRSR